MPAALIPIALMAASAIGGAMANKNRSSTSSSMPQLDPQYQPLQNLILPSIISRLQQPSGVPAGFVETNTKAINDTFDNASMDLNNRLRARGLSTSPIAANAESKLVSRRAGEIARMKTQVPLLEQELQRQSLMDALSVLGLGRGQSSTMTEFGPGRMSNSISGMAQMLGFLYGSGAFGKGIGGQTGAPIA